MSELRPEYIRRFSLHIVAVVIGIDQSWLPNFVRNFLKVYIMVSSYVMNKTT